MSSQEATRRSVRSKNPPKNYNPSQDGASDKKRRMAGGTASVAAAAVGRAAAAVGGAADAVNMAADAVKLAADAAGMAADAAGMAANAAGMAADAAGMAADVAAGAVAAAQHAALVAEQPSAPDPDDLLIAELDATFAARKNATTYGRKWAFKKRKYTLEQKEAGVCFELPEPKGAGNYVLTTDMKKFDVEPVPDDAVGMLWDETVHARTHSHTHTHTSFRALIHIHTPFPALPHTGQGRKRASQTLSSSAQKGEGSGAVFG
jgi:hypothetical protein